VVGPTKFPEKGTDSNAACKARDNQWRFGYWDGPSIYHAGNPGHGPCESYQDVVGLGQAIFNGGQDFFRLARWELWQVA
jgi:hypothetical protein